MLGAAGKVLFRHRGIIPVPFALAAVITLVLRGDTMHGLGIPFWFSILAGTLICAAGHALRIWAIGYAGHETRRVRIATFRLATSGPFAYTRNPIYLGNLAIAVGLALLSRTAWVALMFPLLMFIEYHCIIRYEEEYLDRTFGEEYREYRRRAPRYLGLARPKRDAGSSFAPGETLRKEYQAILATLSTAAVFMAARMIG